MKRANSAMSIFIVFTMTLAWLAISNHCALGAFAPEARTPAADECPFHAKKTAPAKQKESSASPCCKILRAISTKHLTRTIVDLPPVDVVFAKLIVLAPPKISFRSKSLDTGPPGRTSFVELIGSMRAHAPPTSRA